MSAFSISSENCIPILNESVQKPASDTKKFLGTSIDVTSYNREISPPTKERLEQFNDLLAANYIHQTWKDVVIDDDTTSVGKIVMDTSEEVTAVNQAERDTLIEPTSLDKTVDRASTRRQPAKEVKVENNSFRDINSHFDTASNQLNTLKISLESVQQPEKFRNTLTSLETKIEHLRTLSGVQQKIALFSIIEELKGHLTNPVFNKVQPPLKEIQKSLNAIQKSIEEK